MVTPRCVSVMPGPLSAGVVHPLPRDLVQKTFGAYGQQRWRLHPLQDVLYPGRARLNGGRVFHPFLCWRRWWCPIPWFLAKAGSVLGFQSLCPHTSWLLLDACPFISRDPKMLSSKESVWPCLMRTEWVPISSCSSGAFQVSLEEKQGWPGSRHPPALHSPSSALIRVINTSASPPSPKRQWV